MAFIYSEFDSLPSTLVADLKAKILLSSDYSNPTANVVKATTPLGATIAVDLNGVAPTNQVFSPIPWRTWGTTTGTDSYTGRYVWFKRVNSGTTTTNPIHVRVAAGNTLLYVDIEGPRAGEANLDTNNYGSYRNCFALAQITPYMSADTIPAVALLGGSAYNGYASASALVSSSITNVSRNQADSASCVTAYLGCLNLPNTMQYGGFNYTQVASDGSTYLSPYVVFENVAGIRGRLTDVFYTGLQGQISNNGYDLSNPTLAQGDSVTYGGNTYKVLAPYRTDGSGNADTYGSFGSVRNYVNWFHSPLIAVRTA